MLPTWLPTCVPLLDVLYSVVLTVPNAGCQAEPINPDFLLLLSDALSWVSCALTMLTLRAATNMMSASATTLLAWTDKSRPAIATMLSPFRVVPNWVLLWTPLFCCCSDRCR